MTKLQYYLNIVLIIFYPNLFITEQNETEFLITNNISLYQAADEYQDFHNFTFVEAKASQTTLRFVSMIFRHGDRTPDNRETYPNDPYKDEKFYPTGRGELTNAGKKRSYELGLLLRKLYDHFLGTTYYQPHIYARSTFATRCKMTLQLVLAALFPPNNMQQWNHALLWQPMNVRYASLHEDILMVSFRFPIYEATFKKMLNSLEIIAKTEKYRDLMEKVSVYAGTNITTLFDLMIVHTAIHLQLSMKLEIPETARMLYNNTQFSEAKRLIFDLLAYNEELTRLSGGVLLRQIIDDMNKVINGTLKNRKINLFSGHDINVFAILRTLHLKNEIYSTPNFTSGVIFELREWKGKYFVKVLYYWGIPAKVETLSIPGCTLLCPYDKFLNLTSTTVATDADLTGSLHLKEDEYTY